MCGHEIRDSHPCRLASSAGSTPGIILSRIPLRRGLQITFGAGEQIALTHFKTYDHSPISTSRLPF